MTKLLLPTLFVLALASATQAQTVTPNPSPTVITAAPYTIGSAGYYQLGANLTVTATTGDIITINASNVTLDFGGHFISGPADPTTSLTGVHANEKGNLIIQNGTVSHCRQGVLLEGNGQSNSQNYNQRVQNMLVTHCYETGVRLTSASNSVVVNNRISYISNGTNISYVQGIYDFQGMGNIADGNIISNVTTNVSAASACGIAGALTNSSSTLTSTNNRISNVSNPTTPSFALGIYESAFVTGNTIYNAYQAVYTAGKYSNNLTLNSPSPFGGGTDVGGNN